VAPAPRGAAPAPAAEDAPAAAAGGCLARIDSKPPGAEVRIGGKTLGETPLEHVPVPCGDSSVVIDRPRYRVVTETLTAKPGETAALTAHLARPSGALELISMPAGAEFSIEGKSVGKAPRKVEVSRFEHLRLEARLPGQKTWHGKVYMKDPAMKVEARFRK
jgi:hypothetical protein